jgi:hypothetical protein
MFLYLLTVTDINLFVDWLDICIYLVFLQITKGCSRLVVASDEVYQLLAHGRWFSPGTSASSTTKTGGHDIAEILLKVALSTINQINFNRIFVYLKSYAIHTAQLFCGLFLGVTLFLSCLSVRSSKVCTSDFYIL